VTYLSEVADEDLEEGCLACAVETQQTEAFVLFDAETEVVGGQEGLSTPTEFL